MSAQSGLERIVEKEFPAEQQGERVGWISVHDGPRDVGSKVVNVVAATVGSTGARLEYYERDGASLYTRGDDYGFEDATGLAFTVVPEEGVAITAFAVM